jgi:hypothetical protein
MAAGTITVGDAANQIFFKYNHGLNGGNWSAVTRSSSVSTIINSSIPVVANAWYKLKTVVNPTGTNVDFYVDDVLIGSSTTNLPTVAMKFVFKLEKAAGTTARTTSIDYMGWRFDR